MIIQLKEIVDPSMCELITFQDEGAQFIQKMPFL